MLALVAGRRSLRPTPAAADFRLCNNTGSRVGIAHRLQGPATAGPPKAGGTCRRAAARRCCEGTLVARYYYIYAVDYDRGGEWSGQAFMCTRDKEFTIRGTEDCLARGYRPHRLLRGRHRRAARLDGAAHRIERAGAARARAERADDDGAAGDDAAGAAARLGRRAIPARRRVRIGASSNPRIRFARIARMTVRYRGRRPFRSGS